LLQPRKFRAKNVILIFLLVLAAAVVAGVGYLKYQAIRRIQVENAVNEKLSSAASPTLRQALIRVSVSDAREVTLDGIVPSQEDSAEAVSLATSVPGVSQVNNRVSVVVPAQNGNQAETPESLMNRGVGFMDAGDYPSAIDCFTKAAADPVANQKAQELLDRAHQAQTTEQKLLKNRQ
jgi:hypothetical protein